MDKRIYFASPERDLNDNIYYDYQSIHESGYIESMLNALPEVAALLNEHRQIIYANKSLIGFLHALDQEGILGLRPGESIHCVNADISDGGCGTSKKCKFCGAVQAIVESQKLKSKITKECRISAYVGGQVESLDFKVTASPFLFNGKCLTLFILEDISDAKRKQILERIFFHDILNIAGSIKGFADIMKLSTHSHNLYHDENLTEYVDVMGKLSNELLEEIVSQRTLLAAESGDLTLKPFQVSSLDIISETISYLRKNDYSSGKTIKISSEAEDIIFWCDMTILKRIIINMLKNALEASLPNQEITLSCRRDGNYTCFTVHNEGVMPEEVQAQIFQRSFSTKGFDRGIGTYSIKLLTERYLKGSVGFSSSEDKGTTFFANIPY